MFGLLNDLKEYEPKNLKKIKSKEEALKKKLVQRSCIITGIMSLRHLKMAFSCLKIDFNKKESGMSDKSLPNWVKVDKKDFMG